MLRFIKHGSTIGRGLVCDSFQFYRISTYPEEKGENLHTISKIIKGDFLFVVVTH